MGSVVTRLQADPLTMDLTNALRRRQRLPRMHDNTQLCKR
jgi:hypothetical protein